MSLPDPPQARQVGRSHRDGARHRLPPVGTSRAGGKYDIIYLVMTVQEISDTVQYRTLVKDYRDTCLWFADGRLVDHPSDVRQLGMILASIESNGDANAFRRAGEIRQWL